MIVKVKRMEVDNVNLDAETMITVTDEVIRTIYDLPKLMNITKEGNLIEVIDNKYGFPDTQIKRKATEEDKFIYQMVNNIKKYKDYEK